jgi:hypothetical protein
MIMIMNNKSIFIIGLIFSRAPLDPAPSRSASFQSAVPQVCDLQGLEMLRRAEFRSTSSRRPAGRNAGATARWKAQCHSDLSGIIL